MANSEVKRVPGEMSDIDVDFLSLVRKGANKQTIQIYKADESENAPEQPTESDKELKGFFSVLKNFFHGEDVEKAEAAKKIPSFANRMAVVDIMENMYQVNDALRGTLRDIIGDDGIKDKKAAMTGAIDEFAAYMKEKISTSPIAKSANFYNEPKGADEEMNLDDIKKAVAEAVKPISEKVEALEKTTAIDPQSAPEAQGEAAAQAVTPEIDPTEVLKAALGEALKPLTDRITTLENVRGISKGKVPDEQQQLEKGETDVFDNYFA